MKEVTTRMIIMNIIELELKNMGDIYIYIYIYKN